MKRERIATAYETHSVRLERADSQRLRHLAQQADASVGRILRRITREWLARQTDNSTQGG